MNMLVIEHGPEISMPGVARSFGTGGTFQSDVVAALARQRLGQPALLERAHEALVPLGPQRVRARGELVAQADEVVAELGGEEGGGALHRGDLHPVGRVARGSWIRRHWRGSVRY